MYESVPDPYCYPGTSVLENVPGLRDQAELDAFEALITAQRAEEPLPRGRLGYAHYRAIHRHLFQDVFAWAGKLRTVRIAKGDSMFCYPEHIDNEMRALFAGLARDRFLRRPSAGRVREARCAPARRIERDPPFSRRQRPHAARLPDLACSERRTSARARTLESRGHAGRDDRELHKRRSAAGRVDRGID